MKKRGYILITILITAFIISSMTNIFLNYNPSKITSGAITQGSLSLFIEGPSNRGWTNISMPEGIFEPSSSLYGTHVTSFAIKFFNITLINTDTINCIIRLSNSSNLVINKTGISITESNYTLNYTIQSTDPIVYDSDAGFLPWILKSCNLTNSVGELLDSQNITNRIYTHNASYWSDSEVTRAVTCEGTSNVYFNNTGRCEFSEDTMFALQMRNGNPVNKTCFNNPGIACSDNYCNSIFFPTCDPISYFGSYSAVSDDPNNYANFSVSFSSYTTPIAYSLYTNTSKTFKLRIMKNLTNKSFSFTLYNLTNINSANIYGYQLGSGTSSITDQGDGTSSVAYYNFGSFTGTLDFVFNISFSNTTLNENRTLKLVIAYGSSTNQGSPAYFNVSFSPYLGLYNNNESQTTQITTDTGGVCGDEANNDFDYLGTGGLWNNSYDCFDLDCNTSQGDNSQTNEFGSTKTGLCNYNSESNCTDEFDNDYDYILGTDFTDCHDANCFRIDASCPKTETICNDSINNDWDYTLGETNNSASQKIENNGTKYNSTYQADLTDCEDIDCNSSIGSTSGELCNWGFESNCSDNFNNDALQLKDCELLSTNSNTTSPTPNSGEYDCSKFCRLTNTTTETQCDDNIDNDWDAIIVSGYYSNQYSANTTYGAGTDCRWGGYFSQGTNYNPDEDCNQTILSSGYKCELALELNCTDGFDNDYDKDANGMPNSNWTSDQTEYLAYFGTTYSNDADYDDYDCKGKNLAPPNESLNKSWCFDGIDNDLDAYYLNGSQYISNSSTGFDCFDQDCANITNPGNSNQTCLAYEYSSTDSFFTSLSFPGLYCNNSLDDDVDNTIDCADTDCLKQFDMCSQGPCYATENTTWNSCADSGDNDYADGTDCADTDCIGMIGSTTGAICQSTETDCSDNFDNDADNNTDCGDSDCINQTGGKINNIDKYCRSNETTSDCYDGFDNDRDSTIDCYDISCNAACNLSTISGTTPLQMPQWSGQTSLNSVTAAYIQNYTSQIKIGEWYNITFKMTSSSSDAQYTLGTAGSQFNKSGFNTSSAYLAGSDSASFTLTETQVGFIVDSNGASLPGGYTISFLIQATTTLENSTYELTYAEATGSEVSLNNDITYEVDENNPPTAQSLKIIPNNTKIYYGDAVYLRANMSDNALGICDWIVYGAANFNPSNSTQCKGNFIPTIEGTYYINITPIDYYSNNGTTISSTYNVNILPSSSSISADKRFYSTADTITINSTFNLAATDSLGICEILAKTTTTETSLGTFAGSGNSCYGTVSASSLSDGVYSIYAKITESTDNDIIDGEKISVFVCSQTRSGICSFVDYNTNNITDTCESETIPSITPAPGGGGGGGAGERAAGGAGYAIYIITEPELEEGKTLDINKKDIIKIQTVSYGDYTVKILEKQKNSILIEIISSNISQEKTKALFKKGEKKKFDLLNDSYNDLEIEFKGFYEGKIRLYFTEVHEKIEEKPTPKEVIEDVLGSQLTSILIAIIIAAISLMIVALIVHLLRIVIEITKTEIEEPED